MTISLQLEPEEWGPSSREPFLELNAPFELSNLFGLTREMLLLLLTLLLLLFVIFIEIGLRAPSLALPVTENTKFFMNVRYNHTMQLICEESSGVVMKVYFANINPMNLTFKRRSSCLYFDRIMRDG